ncbi:HlyD family secretion protein [Dyella sp. KRB-257]|uniref:HlyD family secretion protein n=1 Tax=Dyella sp. KRB-257 TaxID=3400915 RepID=UPI003BFBE419
MKPLRLAALVAALLLAAGCSHDSPPPAATSATAAYAAVARGRVDVEGGLLVLGTPRDGTLTGVAVHEGDRVSKGQVLATLDPAPARLQLQAAEAELAQARAQRQLLDGKLAAVRVQAQRLTAAAKAGAGDGQSADAATASVNELVARRAAADAAVAMATQKRDEARYELGLRTLRAPVDARVVHVTAQAGASVSTAAGGPLFTLLPLTPPIVRAELSESFVDAVKLGMPATVAADGGGSTRSWPAHVLRIGSVVGPSTLEDDPQLRANARTVACVLAFDTPPPTDVRVGQRVLVRFGAPAASAAPTKGR